MQLSCRHHIRLKDKVNELNERPLLKSLPVHSKAQGAVRNGARGEKWV